MNRRLFFALATATMMPGLALAANREIWSAPEVAEALDEEAIVLLDVRSRDEWHETGLAKNAWPVSMHERGFEQRLFQRVTSPLESPLP